VCSPCPSRWKICPHCRTAAATSRTCGRQHAPDNIGIRINLKTRFAEKDEGKALGARWDPKKKCWYVQNMAELTPFARWITDSPASTSPEKLKGPVVTGGPVIAGCGCQVLPWEDCEHTSKA
jgi:hypothetical protein